MPSTTARSTRLHKHRPAAAIAAVLILATGPAAAFAETHTVMVNSSGVVAWPTNALTTPYSGIANSNFLVVADADAADNDYAKFAATGLEGRSYAEVLSDIAAQPYAEQLDAWSALIVSVAGGNIVEAGSYEAMQELLGLQIGVHVMAETPIGITANYLLPAATDLTPGDYLRAQGGGAETRTAAEVLSDIDAQAADADLDTWAQVSPSTDGRELVAGATYAAMRALLGLVIGTNVQAWDSDLDTWAQVSPSSDGESLVAAANYAAMKELMDLEIDTDLQAWDTDLDTWATVTPSDNGQALVSAADYAAMRALLNVATVFSDTFTILEPDLVQAVSDGIPIKKFPIEAHPNGVNITSISIATPGGCPDAVALEEWENDDSNWGVVDTVDSEGELTGIQTHFGAIPNPFISANNFLAVNLDSSTPTDVAYMAITYTYTNAPAP